MRRGPSRILSAFSILIVIGLYAPIVLVIVNAFNQDELLAHWGGFTWKWFAQALQSSRVRHDFLTSLTIAVISSVLSLAIAIPAAIWWRRASSRGRQLLDVTTYMRIVLPEVVAALSLLILFERLHVPLGRNAVIIGHVVFNSAYAIIIIQARLATLNRVLEDAAADLGAPPHRVFRRVTLPLIMPAVIVAGLLGFTFSFDDVITSSFLGGSQTETLPMLIFGLARFNITPQVNAIGAGLLVITMVSLTVAIIVATARAGGGLFLGARLRASVDE